MIGGIRTNLRRYVMLSLLLIGAIIIGAFTMMSSHYFFEGMDGMQRNTMAAAAKSVNLTQGKQTKILQFNVAMQWSDVEKDIQNQFNQNDIVAGKLYKFAQKDLFFTPPELAYFLLKTTDKQGNTVYVTQVFQPNPNDPHKPKHIVSLEVWVTIVGVLALIGFSSVLFLLMRSVAKPVEKLNAWATSIDKDKLENPIPNFQFDELNYLAHLIHKNILDVTEGVKREQEFLGYASHELRTPIAVIRSSVELLSRLDKSDVTKTEKVIKRIDNASHTMADLTETLLWLSKKDKSALSCRAIQLDELIREISEDLQYLLKNKRITMTYRLSNTILPLPEIACRIVLGNLIRNALQHTHEGEVTIENKGTLVVIHNTEHTTSPIAHAIQAKNSEVGDQLGFGLGLQMVKRLTQQLGWHYEHLINENGHIVKVCFDESFTV